MTLLIAIMVNSIHLHVTGEQFISTWLLVVLWLLHLAYYMMWDTE